MNLGRRRIFVPEVVQTSAMDCGPASLKCLAEGFGIPVSYGRLREACQTDVDGTSIDTMEEVAVQLGLEAEQIMAPADFVLLPEANLLPAIAVVLRAGKITHFVVAWRRQGGLLQVMDPAIGRQWEPKAQFLSSLYIRGALYRFRVERSRLASVIPTGSGHTVPELDCPIRGNTPRSGSRASAGSAAGTIQSRTERRTGRNPVQLLVSVVSTTRGRRRESLL